MSNVQFAAKVRTGIGKGAARSLRRQGFVPGVVYGPKKNTVPVYVEGAALSRFLHSGESNTLIGLNLGNQSKTVLVKAVETDPIRGDYLHVDFYEVPLDKKITTTVPLNITGEDERESDGGIVVVSVREVEVSCLPTNIPPHLDVDVSKLTLGHSLHVSDIPLPEGVEMVSPAEEVVASVVAPAGEPAAEEEAEAPEVPVEGEEEAGEEE